jgi:hypothetical protein
MLSEVSTCLILSTFQHNADVVSLIQIRFPGRLL